MKSKNNYLLMLILISCLSYPGYSENEIQSINKALKVYSAAHREFAAGNHEDAIVKYRAVENYLKTYPAKKRYFDHHYRNFSMIGMVKLHRAINKIKPPHTHKVAALYINKTKTNYKGRIINTVFTAENIKAAELSQKICRNYMEVMTGGTMTLTFNAIKIDAAVTQIAPLSIYDKRQTPEIIINSITPYPSELIYRLSKKYDTLIFYWNHKNRNGQTSYDLPHAWGGAHSLPVTPGHTQTPLRGRIIISAGLTDRPGTLFHELFHTLEKACHINPIHGFRKGIRKNFPDWKGEGEFDYYRYHLLKIKEMGNLRSFNLSETHLFNASSRKSTAYSNHVKFQARERINDSLKIYLKAVYHIKSSPQRAKKYFNILLQKDPCYTPALLQMGSILFTEKKYKTAKKFISRAYDTDPNNPEICYMYGAVEYKEKKLKNSIQLMTEALTINPFFAKAYQYRGFLFYQQGDRKNAEKDFRRAIRLKRNLKNWCFTYLRKKSAAGDTAAKKILERMLKE